MRRVLGLLQPNPGLESNHFEVGATSTARKWKSFQVCGETRRFADKLAAPQMKVNESRAPWFEISIGPILLQLGRYIELRETQYRGCIRLGLPKHGRPLERSTQVHSKEVRRRK